MTGKPYALRLVFGMRKPKNPGVGQEIAGTVVAVGAAVTRFAIGDEVFGIARGAFAEYAVASEAKLAMKPDCVTFEQAAVVAISALTALQAIRDVGRVQAGQQVLIVGASGGVGSYAVQLAKVFGAEVTGVCSAAKLELVRSLGADHVVDYVHDDFADGTHRYDLILDIAGSSSISRLRRALKPRGTAVMVGGEEGDSLTGGMGRQLRARVVSMFTPPAADRSAVQGALRRSRNACGTYRRAASSRQASAKLTHSIRWRRPCATSKAEPSVARSRSLSEQLAVAERHATSVCIEHPRRGAKAHERGCGGCRNRGTARNRRADPSVRNRRRT